MEFILSNPYKPWDWHSISQNPNITMEFILSNPDKPWYWYGISCNPSITMEDISSNHELPWNWGAISRNPNLTMEFILSNPDLMSKWDWDCISNNHFNKHTKQQKIQKFKRKFLVHLLCVSAFNYNEVRYRPGNTGFTQTQTHFNSLILSKIY
jgi:hypothetical protein